MNKLDQIKTLADRIDGPLPHRFDPDQDRTLFRFEMTISERNLIADALTVLYGTEHRSVSSHDRGETQ